MHVKNKPLSDLSHKAIGILIRELGVPDTLRFMTQFSTGTGDYTKEREALFEGVTQEELKREIEALENRRRAV